MSDRNWRSYVGPADNGRTVTSADWVNPPNRGRGYADVFKCSDCENFSAVGVTVEAEEASEDALDCVRGEGYRFWNCVLKGSVTIKGAIDGWMLGACEIHRVIEVGQFDNYWHLGRAPTRNGRIASCSNPDGSPLHVVLWDAETPEITDTLVTVRRIPKWIWLPYFVARYFWIRVFPPSTERVTP